MSNVDLMSVMINPGKIVNGKDVSAPQIVKGKPDYFISAILRNNGPEIIPAGTAKAMITVNNEFLSVPTKRNFKSEQWKYGGIKYQGGMANLWFENKTDLPVGGIEKGLRFDVRGKKKGKCKATMNCSLNIKSMQGDVQPENQSAQCGIEIV